MSAVEEKKLFANTIPECYSWLLGGTDFDKETNRRVFAFAKELEIKRAYDRFTTFPNTETIEGEMIIGNHLKIFSFCEHHLLPFFGEATIAYIPQKTILGLSKFQRLIDKCASKPTLQEHLTFQIRENLVRLIDPKGCAVQIKAIHTCVFARGPQSGDAEFTTTSLYGNFHEPAQRNEFLQSISNNARSRL